MGRSTKPLSPLWGADAPWQAGRGFLFLDLAWLLRACRDALEAGRAWPARASWLTRAILLMAVLLALGSGTESKAEASYLHEHHLSAGDVERGPSGGSAVVQECHSGTLCNAAPQQHRSEITPVAPEAVHRFVVGAARLAGGRQPGVDPPPPRGRV